jgi:hypothetical protein
MSQMMDCLVSYFGIGEDGRSMPGRFFFYQIIGGAGPTEHSGVASIITLAVHDRNEQCTWCQNVHVVDKGGQAAAIAKAIRYLNVHHQGDRLRKVQSAIRHIPEDTSVPDPQQAKSSAFGQDSTPAAFTALR